MFNKLYKTKFYPIIFQIFALIALTLIIIGAIGVTTNNASFAKQIRNTNLSNLIVWSYWWPLIVVSTVLLGRHWCSTCPIELITAITSRIGLQRKVANFLQTEWAITLLYVFVAVVAIHTWGIHRIPGLMAIYLLMLVGFAIIVSLIFEKRAFCSYFCPVGKLLGLYSLLAPLGLRVRKKSVCQSCKTKDCISNVNSDKIIGRSCQSDLYPAKIGDNRDCILCTQCVKVCPNENIRIQHVKKSFLSFELSKLNLAEVGMLIILTGFVSYEILSSWHESKVFLLSPSDWLYELLSIKALSPKLFEGFVVFIVFPLFLVLGSAGLSKLFWGKSTTFHLKRITGYLLPLIAFGHIFKSLLKTTSRIPYWQYSIKQPKGLYYANKILNGEITLSFYSWIETIVIFFGIGGLIFSMVLSFKKLNRDTELQKTNKLVLGFVVTLYFILLLYGPIYGITW